MAIVNRFTFSKNGGPVIMLQLENEYFGPSIPHSPEYLRFLHDIVVDSGFKELLFTSDPGHEAAKMPIKVRNSFLVLLKFVCFNVFRASFQKTTFSRRPTSTPILMHN